MFNWKNKKENNVNGKKSLTTNAEPESLEKRIQNLESSLEALEEKHATALKNYDKIEKDMSNLLPTAITIIGIFTAFLVVFIGGTNMFQALFKSGIELTTAKTLLLIVVTGQIVFNILFLLIFLIGRIADKKVNAECIKYKHKPNISDDRILLRKCADCKYSDSKIHKCGQADKLIHKYPYVIITNFLLFILDMLLGIWWILSSDISSVFQYLLSDRSLIFESLGIIFVIFFIFTFIIYSLGKGPSKYKDNDDEVKNKNQDNDKEKEEKNPWWRRRMIAIIVALIFIIGFFVIIYISLGNDTPKDLNVSSANTTSIILLT